MRIRPDGVLKTRCARIGGFWESKDDIEAGIKAKFARGSSGFNILFEDTHQAILYQGGERALAASFTDAPALDTQLMLFIRYEPREVT